MQDNGVHWVQMDLDRGVVYDFGPRNLTTTSAVILYTAPDSFSCRVRVSTDANFAVFPSAADLPDNPAQRDRRVTVSGLQPKTTYYYRILCATQQPGGAFATLN